LKIKKNFAFIAAVAFFIIAILLIIQGCSSIEKTTLKSIEEGSSMKNKNDGELNSTLNRLQHETSPYLLEHADNPVDWYPWSDEAFQKAAEEDKPIFLSIGYSSCHWCHVMEQESFEDEEVAALMNDVFISIKVDREERPDIDKIYMDIAQLMTGRGGWPLTIIMTPDKKPFYAGTFIPKESRGGLTGMIDLTRNVKEIWANQKEKAIKSADEIADYLTEISERTSSKTLDKAILDSAFGKLLNFHDKENGGFGTAPKFPMPHSYIFLLRYWSRTGNEDSLAIVEKSLQSMRLGGIWDHLGYGFHRYSTDAEWLLPHFEKMLYDQALLSLAYTEAFQATGKEEYMKTAEQIFSYVMRDMTSAEGGFYTAEDADSEGEEGKFYLWTIEEINELLTKDEADFAIDIFDIKEEGNFLDEATKQGTGKNILHMKQPLSAIAASKNMSKEKLADKIEKIRDKLYREREKRIHPLKDDKILTDWNGLMIASLARASGAFNNEGYAKAASKAADFILEKLYQENGELLHSYRSGEAEVMANLDDYSFFIMGLLELYEATFEINYLKKAIELNDKLIEDFWDFENGGFFFTSSGNRDVIARMKYGSDGAIPSGNSIAMLNLIRLGKITGSKALTEKATTLGEVFFSDVEQNPDFHTQFMVAYDFLFGPSYEVIICGKGGAKDTEEFLDALRSRYVPSKIIIFKSSEESPEITGIAEYIKNYKSIDNKATAYVCVDYQCNLPTNDPDEMLDLLLDR
jgi:uncharacterized protein YyaL (SSP411 family)